MVGRVWEDRGKFRNFGSYYLQSGGGCNFISIRVKRVGKNLILGLCG